MNTVIDIIDSNTTIKYFEEKIKTRRIARNQ